MARRRNRVLAGLGEGVTNAGSLLLRQVMQDRSQDRIDRRQHDNNLAILGRQADMKNQEATIELLKSVAGGERDPEQAASLIAALTGKEIDPLALESVRPSPRRRMEKAAGEGIEKATKPEEIPTDTTIASLARTEGLALPDAAYAGIEPTSYAPDAQGNPTGDPYEYVGGVAREFGERAGARRRSLESTPTETVDVQLPSGEEQKQFVSKYAGPVTTKPDAAQQGTIAGEKKTAELGASGDALAGQVEKEQAARNKADNAPEAVNARVNEAVRKASGEARAKLKAELDIAGVTGQQQQAALALADDYTKQSGVFNTTKQAVSSIVTLANRIEAQRKTGADSPAAHIGLIFNFMKMQDPGSTVREGEQAMASNAAGVDERVRNLYNSVVKGGRLSPEQVTDFVNTAASVYKNRAAEQQALESDFTQRATKFGVPPQLVTGYVSALANGPKTAVDKLRER